MATSSKPQKLFRVPEQGFSLVELLVVAAILSIVMAAVLGTVSVATRTTRTNTQLTDANQNVRASLRLMSNDISTCGEFLSTPTSFARVRGGFLASIGFPTSGVTSAAPAFDRIYAIQAWTTPSSGGSASLATFNTQTINGFSDTTTGPMTDVDANLRIYPGASGVPDVGTTYRTGTDQILVVQANPCFVNFTVPAPTPTDPAATTQRIFPLTSEYTARATYPIGLNNLVLVPNLVVAGQPSNYNPTAAAAGASFVNPADRLLANRLQPFVDTLLIQVTAAGNTTTYLGLVTEVNTTTGAITLRFAGTAAPFNDEIGLNLPWSAEIPANTIVQISRMSMIHYFIGWTGNDSVSTNPNNLLPPILFRKEGASVSPVSIGIENMQFQFDLIDEAEQVGLGRGRFVTVSDLGIFPSVGSNPVRTPETRTAADTRCMVRTVRAVLYGRSVEQVKEIFWRETAIPNAYDRGYYHVKEQTTIGMRNFAYTNSR